MSWVLVAAVAPVVVGAFVSARARRLGPGLTLQALGLVAFGVVGGWTLVTGDALGAGFTSSFAPRLGVDPLSGTFLLILALVGAPALVYATTYLHPTPTGRATAALCGPFVLALAGVTLARDPLTFLLCWELMTLVPAAIILVERHDEAARTAVVRLRRDHASRWRRGLGRRPAARAARSDRRLRRSPRGGAADRWSRSRRSSGSARRPA